MKEKEREIARRGKKLSNLSISYLTDILFSLLSSSLEFPPLLKRFFTLSSPSTHKIYSHPDIYLSVKRLNLKNDVRDFEIKSQRSIFSLQSFLVWNLGVISVERVSI